MLDTRSGNGYQGKLIANTPITFQVTGRVGIPAGAVAVTGNVTVVKPSAGWALYIGPAPKASPATSTINFTAGQTIGNGLTVALSGTGSLSATYMSGAGSRCDLVLDVTGYYTADNSGQTYHAMVPVRDLDTRIGNGLTGKLVANTPRTFAVAGRNGVPVNAKAVTGNVTVVGPSYGWAVYLGPSPLSAPTTSALNFAAGATSGNNLTVPLSSTGTLSATFMSTTGSTTDLVFDVTGYYTADLSGLRFVAIEPGRLLDTRNGNGLLGRLTANTPRTFGVSGRSGIPANAAAVTGNLTVVDQTASWALYLGPTSQTWPSTSTLNFTAIETRGNGLVVALGPGGTLSITYMSSPGATCHAVFDATGYFVL